MQYSGYHREVGVWFLVFNSLDSREVRAIKRQGCIDIFEGRRFFDGYCRCNYGNADSFCAHRERHHQSYDSNLDHNDSDKQHASADYPAFEEGRSAPCSRMERLECLSMR